MGAECERLEIAQGRLIVERPSVLPVATRYDILLPKGWTYQGEAVVSVTLGPGQTKADIPVETA